MRARIEVIALLTAFAAGVPASGGAQTRPLELGIDAGGSLNLSGGDTEVVVGVPVQNFRVGIFLSDAVSLEPRVALTYVNLPGESLVAIASEIGPVFHFSPERGRPQGYFRPFGGVAYVTDADAVFSLGGAVGVKLPVAERLAARVEGSYAHGFDDFRGGDAIGLMVGLSFFTR